MFIGILQFELLIPGSESLKDKRRVVRSVKDRLHREHQVSVAETGLLEQHSAALLGLAIVSGTARHAGQTLDRIAVKLHGLLDAEVGEMTREVVSGQAIIETPRRSVPPDSGGPVWSERELEEIVGEVESELDIDKGSGAA